jgi:hypothetical protein
MHRLSLALPALFTATVIIAACGDRSKPVEPLVAPSTPRFHVGYKGPDVTLGYVTNAAECHVGKKGDRWPLAEQYDVKTFDAHLTVAPNGAMTLVCIGDIPSNQPTSSQAEVEPAVLCFLPNQLQTRQAQEVFTPSGKIILTCHLNPEER